MPNESRIIMIDDQADTFELQEYASELSRRGNEIGPEFPQLYQKGLTVQNIFKDVDIFIEYLGDITMDKQGAINELQSIKAIVFDINMPPGEKNSTISSRETGKMLTKIFYTLFFVNKGEHKPLFFTLSNYAPLDNIEAELIGTTHLSKLAEKGSRKEAYIANCKRIDEMIRERFPQDFPEVDVEN